MSRFSERIEYAVLMQLHAMMTGNNQDYAPYNSLNSTDRALAGELFRHWSHANNYFDLLYHHKTGVKQLDPANYQDCMRCLGIALNDKQPYNDAVKEAALKKLRYKLDGNAEDMRPYNALSRERRANADRLYESRSKYATSGFFRRLWQYYKRYDRVAHPLSETELASCRQQLDAEIALCEMHHDPQEVGIVSTAPGHEGEEVLPQ